MGNGKISLQRQVDLFFFFVFSRMSIHSIDKRLSNTKIRLIVVTKQLRPQIAISEIKNRQYSLKHFSSLVLVYTLFLTHTHSQFSYLLASSAHFIQVRSLFLFFYFCMLSNEQNLLLCTIIFERIKYILFKNVFLCVFFSLYYFQQIKNTFLSL